MRRELATPLTEDKEFGQKIVQTVREFLLKYGGMRNGSRTYVEGTVQVRPHVMGGRLSFSTPDQENYTYRWWGMLEEELFKEIYNVAILYDVSFITFKKEHIEYGAYDTLITFGKAYTITM